MSLKKLTAGILGAALVATPALAQTQTEGTKSDRDAGRIERSDQDGGGASPTTSAPDPYVGNNSSKGTDARGTVDPPARDKDANDALKKKE